MKLAASFRDAASDAAQMKQARAFDAFRAHEEEENLRAWEEAACLAKQLEELSDPAAQRLGEELCALVHKRLSFADELGFSENEMSSEETASGMIAVDGVKSNAITQSVAAVQRRAAAQPEATAQPGAIGQSGTAIQSVAALCDIETLDSDDLEEAVVPGGLKSEPCVCDSTAFASESHDMPELIDSPVLSAFPRVATFKHLCDGRDGKLCLFEDADGHLVAVRASRLA